ncbi:hypothetical protein ASPWEDRAFT_589014 [Aspergillus wentii DTO 134E9]|uniref:Uncharacterized protein n=1 Tax=Aspergillus wentii DTO 134E9 TaxID=1073089 RepID=A0A1L9RCS6_ASPWE|nr:uncharacterized protein ASPWEDRAFT_589014 [Aspergillus wentii DTO 134E9]KAI9924247.1 hypothetical protein MW887_007197 [Aspergillus wentii]OJJ32663.1 hypothetical protein ASPWEDRAFT_589014 [Aspergillus wentii DTO 134E9]
MKFFATLAAAGLAFASSAVALELPLAEVLFVQEKNVTQPQLITAYNGTCGSLSPAFAGVTTVLNINAEGGHDPRCKVFSERECQGASTTFKPGQHNFQSRFVSGSVNCVDPQP